MSPATFAKLAKHLASLDDKETGEDRATDPVPGDAPGAPAGTAPGASAADDLWFASPPGASTSGTPSARTSPARSASRPGSGTRPPRPIGAIGNGGAGSGGISSRSGGSSRRRGASRKNLFRRRSRGKRILIWSLLGLGALLIVAGVVIGNAYYTAYQAYGDLKQVPPLVEAARKQLQQGRLPQHDELERASGMVGLAQGRIDSAAFPFRVVSSLPLLGRPIQAITLATDAASKEASAAVIVQGLITKILGPDPGGSAPSPAFHDGVIDVDLLSSVTPQLERVVAYLRSADASVRAIPSVPFVHTLDSLKAQVLTESAQAVSLSERALSAFRLLPNFFGADGPKRYYLAMQNNDDQRGTGGAVLSYAIMTIDHGRLSLDQGGPIGDIDPNKVGNRAVVPKAAEWYLQATGVVKRLANGVNYSPDFPVAAQAWRAMLEQSTLHTRVDGVIALDPYAVAAALAGEKPITNPDLPMAITSSNLVQFVMHDQYLLDKSVQRAVPGFLIAGAYNAIATPSHLFDLMHGLSGALVAKHIQVWTVDPDVQGLVSQLGWDGAIRNTAGGDYLNLAYEKRLGNKVDFFTEERVDYDVTVLPSGGIRSRYVVGMSLDAMPDGLPFSIAGQSLPYGANLAMFNLYVPGSARFLSVSPSGDFPPDAITLQGKRNPTTHVRPKGFVQHTEGPFEVFTQTILVSPGHQGSLEYRYSVPGVIKETPQGKVYTLTVQHQPLVNPQNLRVVLHLPEGSEVVSLAPGWTVNSAAHIAIYQPPQGVVTQDFTTSIVFR